MLQNIHVVLHDLQSSDVGIGCILNFYLIQKKREIHDRFKIPSIGLPVGCLAVKRYVRVCKILPVTC